MMFIKAENIKKYNGVLLSPKARMMLAKRL